MVFDFSRGPGFVPSHPFLLRGSAKSLLYRITGLRVLKFLETQSRSGATQSVSALSFHSAWMSVGGSEWGSELGPTEGKVSEWTIFFCLGRSILLWGPQAVYEEYLF